MNLNEQMQAFDQDEEFEVGRQSLVDELGEPLSFSNEADFAENTARLCRDQQKLAAFWFAYFTARLKIEQSYDFLQAFKIFDWGLEQLERMQEPTLRPEPCVELRARIAVMSVEEDRGMHNNHFVNTLKACDKALALISEYPQCTEALQTKITYIQALKAFSELLLRRERGEQISEAQWQQLKTTMQQAYQDTSALKVYSSMLKSYLLSIDSLKNAPANKLRIMDGRLTTVYYATINSMQVDSLVAFLQEDSKRQQLQQALKSDAFYEPEPPDVLSDMSVDGQFHIWQFDLDSVVLPSFRDDGIEYAVNLRFNSLGLVQLQLEVNLAQMDVNAYRHLINLPLENALDEEVYWDGQRYLYLRDVASKVFATIEVWFGQEECLIYNTSEHVSSTSLIETLEVSDKPGELLSFSEVQAHPDWKGLQIPPREVRSTFENWRLQQPHAGVKNIATDLYHHDDWVQADGSYALIVSLGQPSWVTDQALENVLVATGARYYMMQLGKMLFANVRSIQQAYHDDEDIDDKSRYELREQEKVYRRRVKALHLLNMEVRDLLHLMDTGGLMRFPDHGRFVQALFVTVGVNNERKALLATLKESNDATRFLRNQMSNALEQLRERSSQRFDAVIGFMGILLSVGALSDMFDIIEETGMDIPALIEAEIIFGAMILIVLYFSIEAIIRRFK